MDIDLKRYKLDLRSLYLAHHWFILNSKTLCWGLVTFVATIAATSMIKNILTAVIDSQTIILNANNQAALSEQTTSSSTASDQKNFNELLQRKIFGKLDEQKSTNLTAAPAPPQVSKSQLALIGTFIFDESDPYAIIEDTKKTGKDDAQEIFRIGETIFKEAVLTKILPDSVEINRNGKVESLSLDNAPKTKGSSASESETDSAEITVDGKELQSALDNMPQLLTESRAVPYFKNGKAIGLRIFAIKEGSLYEKIGLKNGDILKSINESSLADITQAIKLFDTLRDEKSLSLVIERSSKEMKMNYTIR